MSPAEIVPIPQLRDNYGYLVVDAAAHAAIVIDAAEPEPVEAALTARGLALAAVLTTHHHPDHSGGNAALAARHPGLRVIGSALDAARIPAITERLSDGDRVTVGQLELTVRLVPCHTSGHLVFVLGDDAFTGDTLFSGGCGRFFEGSAADMYHALYEIIGALPDRTRLWCGHEYTAKNLEFAASLEPENQALVAKRAEVASTRAAGRPTVPATLGAERGYNPFLRVREPALIAAVQARMPTVDARDPAAILGAVRALKDAW